MFYLSLRLITLGGRSAHLAYQKHYFEIRFPLKASHFIWSYKDMYIVNGWDYTISDKWFMEYLYQYISLSTLWTFFIYLSQHFKILCYIRNRFLRNITVENQTAGKSMWRMCNAHTHTHTHTHIYIYECFCYRDNVKF